MKSNEMWIEEKLYSQANYERNIKKNELEMYDYIYNVTSKKTTEKSEIQTIKK